MPKKENIFRFAKKNREGIILWMMNFGICLAISIYAEAEIGVIIFSVLFIYSVFNLFRSFHEKVRITDTEILATHNFKTKVISWSQISVVEPKHNGYLLTNSDSTIQVFVSGQIVNLWRFVKLISDRRRDLLQSDKIVFHENPFVAILLGTTGLFIIYLSVT